MIKYVNRLVKCGYTYDTAYGVCADFICNLSLFDLECFVQSMENIQHVD